VSDGDGPRSIGQRFRHRPRRAAVLVLLLLVLAPLGCREFMNRALLYPSHDERPTRAVRETFTGRGEAIEGREVETFWAEYGKPGIEPELYVLGITGNAGRAESMQDWSARLLAPWLGGEEAPARIGLLTLQHPGFGTRDDGGASLESLAQASVEALERLARRAGPRPVFVHALSMGTTAALYAARTARDASVAGLVLEKPPDLGPLIVGEHGWWNLWLIALPVAWLLPDSVDSEANAAALGDVPALFFVSDDDTVVPRRYALRVFEAYAGPKRLVDCRGGHGDAVTRERAPDFVDGLRWLWQARRSRAAGPGAGPTAR